MSKHDKRFEAVGLVSQPDVSDQVKVGDRVAVCWFDDPHYYRGVIKSKDGGLFIDTTEGPGYLAEAHHVIKLDDAIREDQVCQGFSCGAAPLGCSDKTYCPGPPR